jgi:hypothetical protein
MTTVQKIEKNIERCSNLAQTNSVAKLIDLYERGNGDKVIARRLRSKNLEQSQKIIDKL